MGKDRLVEEIVTVAIDREDNRMILGLGGLVRMKCRGIVSNCYIVAIRTT